MNFIEKLDHSHNRFVNACAELKCGKPVLLADDGVRENEIDLIFAAEHASEENVNLAISYAKGLLCVALSAEHTDLLGLPVAPKFPSALSHTGYTLSVDAKSLNSSGISARDRAVTLSALAQENTRWHDFVSPGHVFPLRAQANGLLSRCGHTEASVTLAKASGCHPAVALCEVLDAQGKPASPQLFEDKSRLLQTLPQLAHLAKVSVLDILLNELFFEPCHKLAWKQEESAEKIVYTLQNHSFFGVFLPTRIEIFKDGIEREHVAVCYQNHHRKWESSHSYPDVSACIHIMDFNLEGDSTHIPEDELTWFDLSNRFGIASQSNTLSRIITLVQAQYFTLSALKKLDLNKNIQRTVGSSNALDCKIISKFSLF